MRPLPALALLAFLALPRTLHAHIHLVRSAPAADSAAAGPVRELRLTFSERPEVGFSRVRLFAADSTEITLGAISVVAGDSMTVRAAISRRLAAGIYVVRWQTAGRDGHVIRGQFSFTAPEDVVIDSAPTATAPVDSTVGGTEPASGGGFPVAVVGVAAVGALAAFFFLRSRR